MALTCEYCKATCEEGALKCRSCGAPVSSAGSPAPDYRVCPYCNRKLLALGSPACNYCGRRLPDEYIKARESDLLRIIDIEEGGKAAEANTTVAETLLHPTHRGEKKPSPLSDILDIAKLRDLFS